jgi:hypothetical protein
MKEQSAVVLYQRKQTKRSERKFVPPCRQTVTGIACSRRRAMGSTTLQVKLELSSCKSAYPFPREAPAGDRDAR